MFGGRRRGLAGWSLEGGTCWVLAGRCCNCCWSLLPGGSGPRCCCSLRQAWSACTHYCWVRPAPWQSCRPTFTTLTITASRPRPPATTLTSAPPTAGTAARAAQVPGASVHWYGKAEVADQRKVGHITIVGRSNAECRQRLRAIDPRELASLRMGWLGGWGGCERGAGEYGGKWSGGSGSWEIGARGRDGGCLLKLRVKPPRRPQAMGPQSSNHFQATEG